MSDQTYTRSDLLACTGLSKADLDYYLAQGVVRPLRAVGGRGRPLAYGRADLVVAMLMAELKRHNIATAGMREVADSLYGAIDLARTIGLPTDQTSATTRSILDAAQDSARTAEQDAANGSAAGAASGGGVSLVEAAALDHYHRLLDPAYLSDAPPLYLLDIPADADLGLTWRDATDSSPVELGDTASCLTVSVTAINRRLFLGDVL